MKAKRVCSEPGCPALTEGGRCVEHARFADRARGSRTDRGYGSHHQAARAKWKPLVQAGDVNCWRCGLPINPDSAWDLGHDDLDRSITRGPEHANQCNRSAAGRSRHGLAPK